MKAFFVLVASLIGCASIPGQRAGATATIVETPADRVVRDAAASAPRDLHRRRELRTSERRQLSIDTSSAGAEGRLQISPPLRSLAPDHAVLAASTLRPLEWSRAQWITLLTDMLSNETLAHAAAWIARQPLYVRVSGGGFSVAIRMATP